jgi:predicted small secreted protein
MKRIAALLLIASALLLTGCATTRTVSSQVTAVATVPAGAQLQAAKYRFERLPLQVHNPEAGLAEQQAEQALAAVGLVRDDAQAQLSVLVGFQSSQYVYDPSGRLGANPWRPYGAFAIGRHGAFGYNWGVGMSTPPMTDYRREVSLVLRDLRTGQVVYETRASHYGVWRDSETIFATLFKAALANFPNPPAGVQRVNIEIPN